MDSNKPSASSPSDSPTPTSPTSPTSPASQTSQTIPTSSRPYLPTIITTPKVTISDDTKAVHTPSVNTPGIPRTPTFVDSLNTFSPHSDKTNPFAFTPEQLSRFFEREKTEIELLHNIGGVEGLLKGLHSDATFGLGSDEYAPFDPITLNSIVNEDKTGLSDVDNNREPEKEIERVGTTQTTTAYGEKPFSQRRRVFGSNVLPIVKTKSIFQLMWQALQDKTLILLTIAAIVSLAVGIYEDYGIPADPVISINSDGSTTTTYPAKIKWVEGVAIIVAILVVVMVGSVNDYQKEKQFQKLNAKKDDRSVKGTRSGEQVLIPIQDIQVGDILHLEPGDVIAADGVYIEGHNLSCDETSATGESDSVKKLGWKECYRMYMQSERDHDDARSVSAASGISTPLSPITPVDGHRKSESGPNHLSSNDHYFLAPPSPVSPTSGALSRERKTTPESHLPSPFIMSGSSVLEGVGTYIVTGVGAHSAFGKLMLDLRHDPEETPLQAKLNQVAEKIAKLGGAAALLMLIVLFIKYFVGWKSSGVPGEPTSIVQDLMQIIITTITIVVVAVPEGLPLAVTLSLAYATQRMLKDNNLVRVLAACETMGNATVICSDKTGTLTQNKMSVVAGTFGTSFRFVVDPPLNRQDLIAIRDVPQKMAKPLFNLVNQSIAVNSTAFESKDGSGQSVFVGSKTETALLSFSRNIGAEKFEVLRKQWEVRQLYPFSSERKAMGTVIKIPVYENGKKIKTIYRAHIKGASEVLVQNCNSVVLSRSDEYSNDDSPITTRRMTSEIENRMNKIIQSYAVRSLRTIAICYRDFDSWPPTRSSKFRLDVGGPKNNASLKPHSPTDTIVEEEEEPEMNYSDIIADRGLTLIGIVGIEDPLREGVKEAVQECQNAGVFVRMVTGDNVLTAKSIAKQCGIYTTGGLVMEGPVFRRLPLEKMDEVIPRLQVLARSSPEDKLILVRRLKEMGETVAVTGDGTNDGPALKNADVGFSMGISGTEVAKEASSIILMDDNFSSIVKAIKWGRSVNDSVKKFLQFQLTVNVTAVLLAFVSAVSDSHQQSVLTAVQLLWVNLIMDTFAALALATDPPTPDLLNRDPEPKSAPLITFSMWKMIIGQSIFQLVITLVLFYGGDTILGYNTTASRQSLQTVVFNTFVFLQIFNEINSRVITNELNVFKGIWANKFFVLIFFITVAGQILIVEVGSTAFNTVHLDGVQWAITVCLGLVSLPVGVILRLIPDDIFGIFFRNPQTRERYLHPHRPKSTRLTPSVYVAGNERLPWQSAYSHVRSQLTVFKSLRGGRLSQSESVGQAFAAAAVGTGMVASSVGVGWVPTNGNASSPSQSFVGLEKKDTGAISLDRRDSL